MIDGGIELAILGLLAACGATALACLALGFAPLLRAPREIPGGPPSAAQRESVAPAQAPVPLPTPARKPIDWRAGLRRTRGAFVERMERLLGTRPTLDADALAQLEELLFGADLGARTADQLLDVARACASPDLVREALERRALAMLAEVPPPPARPRTSPHVILVVGVNGSGKTTSIAKLARREQSAGRRVLLAAADTFRAAAIDQLAVWAERVGVELIRSQPGGDPAAVAFEAVQAARAGRGDVVLIDTAGRLQTDRGLMDELAKIARVVKKELPDAPHEVLLVLDANTGQNAIRQAQEFARAVPVTGIVLTKLDGTAKGGVVLGIAQEVRLPVQFVGLGEGLDDLAEFSPPEFIAALFGRP
jgi:fused signal recognition particle receptor